MNVVLLIFLILITWSWTLAVPAWFWLPMSAVVLVLWMGVNARKES